MPPTTYTWHIEDRRVRRTLDRVEYELGLRKTLPPPSYYNLTHKQIHAADERAAAIIMTGSLTKKAA